MSLPPPPVPPNFPDPPEHLRDLTLCHCVDFQTGGLPDPLPWAKLGDPVSINNITDTENVWLVMGNYNPFVAYECIHKCPGIGWTMLRQLAECVLYEWGWRVQGYLILEKDIPDYLYREEICNDHWFSANLSTFSRMRIPH